MSEAGTSALAQRIALVSVASSPRFGSSGEAEHIWRETLETAALLLFDVTHGGNE